jgi:hypothetical protein
MGMIQLVVINTKETISPVRCNHKGKEIPQSHQQQQVRQSKQHSHVSPHSQQQNIVARLSGVNHRLEQ